MVGELVLLNVGVPLLLPEGDTDGVGSELCVILELAPKEIVEGGVGDGVIVSLAVKDKVVEDVSLPVAVKEDV